MNDVYLNRPPSGSGYLGRVEQDGKVYERRKRSEKYIGRVDLQSGKVYESRLGPDKYLGFVHAREGKVFLGAPEAEELFGRVHADGKLFLAKSLHPDDYLARVEQMTSLLHGGAAFLLLVVPLAEEQEAAEEAEARLDEQAARADDTGDALSPA